MSAQKAGGAGGAGGGEGTRAASGQGGGRHTAGAFDVRSVIAGLIGLFGVVLVVYGLVDPSADLDKTGGVNANLWSGLVMLGVALAFALWVKLRPIVLEGDHPADGG